MAHITRCQFLHTNGIIQQDWIEQWQALESWLDRYTPGWQYVQVEENYCIEFTCGSHLTMYLLRWNN